MEGDHVDLRSCPHLKDHPSAPFEFGEVVHVERVAPDLILIGYEGIDYFRYPLGTILTVSRDSLGETALQSWHAENSHL